MGLGDMWSRTLVYFGIAEEDDWDDDTRTSSPRRRPSASRGVGTGTTSDACRAASRTGPTRARSEDRGRAPSPPPSAKSHAARACAGSTAGSSQVRVHLVLPRSFNDAQQIADKFKDSVPVILNLQSADTELSKRMIDFASGLTYALDGSMQRVADKVFLLTPRNVEVSAEERARVLDRGGFFNQA